MLDRVREVGDALPCIGCGTSKTTFAACVETPCHRTACEKRPYLRKYHSIIARLTFEAVPAADQESAAKCASSNSLILSVRLEGILFWTPRALICKASLNFSGVTLGENPSGQTRPRSVPQRDQRPKISPGQRCWTHRVVLGLHMQRLRNRILRKKAKDGFTMSTKHTTGEAQKAGASPWLCPENVTRGARTQERCGNDGRAQRTAHTGTKRSTLCKQECSVGRCTLLRVFKLRILVPTSTRRNSNDLLNWWAPWKGWRMVDPVPKAREISNNPILRVCSVEGNKKRPNICGSTDVSGLRFEFLSP